MAKLTRDTVLQRIPDLKLSIGSSNQVKIFIEDRVIRMRSHGLAVLDAFSRPISIEEALKKLENQTTGSQDWMDLTTSIMHLYEAGILQGESRGRPVLKSRGSGYDSAPIHVAMLNDRERTARFVAGIQEVVHPGDIVADIGTGTGVLAIAAAQAGAQHVYAIEASGIGKLAKEIIKANGFKNRITLIEGWSTQVNLPEPADVLVSEMIGNEPLAENVLEITIDAIKRLLKPDARLIPHRVRIFGLPVTIPQTELMQRTFVSENLQNWNSWYNIDFSPLSDIVRNSPHTFFINPFHTREWRTLSEPILLADVDFDNIGALVIDNKRIGVANASGQFNGLLEYFQLDLGPTTRFSTHPSQADENNHWRSPVWVFLDSLNLEEGDHFEVSYGYRMTEDRTKVSISRK